MNRFNCLNYCCLKISQMSVAFSSLEYHIPLFNSRFSLSNKCTPRSRRSERNRSNYLNYCCLKISQMLVAFSSLEYHISLFNSRFRLSSKCTPRLRRSERNHSNYLNYWCPDISLMSVAFSSLEYHIPLFNSLFRLSKKCTPRSRRSERSSLMPSRSDSRRRRTNAERSWRLRKQVSVWLWHACDRMAAYRLCVLCVSCVWVWLCGNDPLGLSSVRLVFSFVFVFVFAFFAFFVLLIL